MEAPCSILRRRPWFPASRVVASELARRSPALGALVVSLPLISILAMIWLHHETHDTARGRSRPGHLWYVLPSLSMFLVLPALLRHGLAFYPSLAICVDHGGCSISAWPTGLPVRRITL